MTLPQTSEAAPNAEACRPPLGVYVHWPFCAAICPYCDFNVHLAGRDGAAHASADWAAAYRAELNFAHELRPDGPVETVFFGGGTPSLMPLSVLDVILGHIDRLWGLAPQAEISLEANPMSAVDAHLKNLRSAGVTRLSLGVQAFDDAALKKLGRTHTADEARAAFAAAQEIFPFSSFDLIYARPEQGLDAWQRELTAALALGANHMSLYQLTIEPDTPYAKLAARGKLIVPDEAQAADMYEMTQELCATAGLPAYEISNHAKPGHECRHNMASWQGGDYIGLGPGAHGRMSAPGGRLATQAARRPADWLAAVAADGHGWHDMHVLDDEARAGEAVMLGLRLRAGVALADLAARGVVLDAAKLAAARHDGLLSGDALRLQASKRGHLLLDTLIGRLLV